MNEAMPHELELLEEQVEKLKNAVRALTSFAHDPQERLDRALSYFVRTFREPPTGDALQHYTDAYGAIGDPPVGTTLHVEYDRLTPDEREAIGVALVELLRIMAQRYAAAQQRAAAEPHRIVESTIAEGPLETLVPGRAHTRSSE